MPSFDRRTILLSAAAVSAAPAASAAASSCPASGALSPGPDEPLQKDTQETLLAHARELMTRNYVAALVTTDETGLPRVRSVGVGEPEADFTVWVATNPISRKVRQIRAQPEVALHYSDGDEIAAVTLMGPATIHEDMATITEKNFYSPEDLRGSWPDFPKNFCMLAIKPRWLEIVRIGKISGDPARWRPQGTRF
jgi:general stress protein 26